MNRLTVEKPVNEMDMTELAYNCMFAKNKWAWYRDYEGEKDLMELIREINVVIGGGELPENNTLLEEVLYDNLQYPLSDKDGFIAFIYQSLWTKADLRERLKDYEDLGVTPEQIRDIDKLYAEKCRELEVLKKNHGFPCTVGDAVYNKKLEKLYVIEIRIADDICFHCCKDRANSIWTGSDFSADDFGKIVFLTREDAEAKLAEMEGNSRG